MNVLLLAGDLIDFGLQFPTKRLDLSVFLTIHQGQGGYLCQSQNQLAQILRETVVRPGAKVEYSAQFSLVAKPHRRTHAHVLEVTLPKRKLRRGRGATGGFEADKGNPGQPVPQPRFIGYLGG